MSLLVSASQISLFDENADGGCKRKYAFSYVCGIKSPGTKAQELGKEVDDNQLQPYLSKGRSIDAHIPAGEIALSALKYLPQPMHPGLEVQKALWMPSPSKLFAYRGYLDLWLPFRGLPDMPSDEPGIPIVSDFKTSGNLDWAKTETTLAEDVQAQLYATWAMWERKVRTVDLVWIYMLTKGTKRKSKRVHIRVDGAHVFHQFKKIDALGRQIYELRKAAEGLEGDAAMAFAMAQKPNPSACGAFGGCPHRHLCNLTDLEFVDTLNAPGAATKRYLPVMESIDLFADLETRKPEAPAEVVALGINPPEKDLPEAPAVGAVVIPDAQPPLPASEQKAKRTRRTKAQMAADNAAASAGKTGADLVAEMQANTAPKGADDVPTLQNEELPVRAEDIAFDPMTTKDFRGYTRAQEAGAPFSKMTLQADGSIFIGREQDTGAPLEKGVEFDVAWAELGSAVKRFLYAVGGR